MPPHRWQPTKLPHPWDSPGKNTGVGCLFLLQCMKVKSEFYTNLTESLKDSGCILILSLLVQKNPLIVAEAIIMYAAFPCLHIPIYVLYKFNVFTCICTYMYMQVYATVNEAASGNRIIFLHCERSPSNIQRLIPFHTGEENWVNSH